jgi:hypothetical protein
MERFRIGPVFCDFWSQQVGIEVPTAIGEEQEGGIGGQLEGVFRQTELFRVHDDLWLQPE